MGTRHLICIFWKGKWYLAQYGQFDGYPDVQGVKIFNFLSVARNIDNLKVGLEHHIYEPTREELDAIWDECDAWDENRLAQNLPYEYRMFGVNQLYPSLARETSAGILGLIARAGLVSSEDGAEGSEGGGADDGVGEKPKKKIPVILKLEFANDGLFCEWAYVIDLDKEVLEVYGGCENKHDSHRFKDVGDGQATVPAFFGSFDFRELYLMESDKEFMDKIKQFDERQAGGDKSNDLGVRQEVLNENVSEGDEEKDEDEAEHDDGAEGSEKGSP